MGGKTCAAHADQAAVSVCHRCRKDLCKLCVMVTPSGTFCSSECAVLHRELKSPPEVGQESSSPAMKAVLVLLTLVAIMFLVHLVPATSGKPFDLIGRIMKRSMAK